MVGQDQIGPIALLQKGFRRDAIFPAAVRAKQCAGDIAHDAVALLDPDRSLFVHISTSNGLEASRFSGEKTPSAAGKAGKYLVTQK